jgi:hypothetical protein
LFGGRAVHCRAMGSSAAAALIAQVAFWLLLAFGWLTDEVRLRSGTIFLMLWLIGFLTFRYLVDAALFSSYVAVLDVALVFLVFKGDVRLT